MNTILNLILEWDYPVIPMVKSHIYAIKDITKKLKKQHSLKAINIITNSEECAFLLPKAKYYKQLSKVKARKNFQTYFQTKKNRENIFIWATLGQYSSTSFLYSLIPEKLPKKYREVNYPSINMNFNPSSKTILIRADGGKLRGTGHLYRALTLAEFLINEGFKPTIVTLNSVEMNLGLPFLDKKDIPFQTIENEQEFYQLVEYLCPDLLSLDILNISQEYVAPLKKYAKHIISFENLGEGALDINFTINDLYINPLLPNKKQFSGLKYALLNQYFENILEFYKPTFNNNIKTILILFGGTDPSGLTLKTLQALAESSYNQKVILIQNFQQESISNIDFPFQLEIFKQISYMPQYMAQIDLAISSAGRSILELISMGVPTICMSQNQKELMHTHSIGSNGILNIGLGSTLSPVTIASYITMLIENQNLRKTLYNHTLIARKEFSNQRIMKKILALLK